MNSVKGPELADINLLHPLMRGKVVSTVLKCRDIGLPIGIYCTIRSFKAQDTLFSLGRDLNGIVADKSKVVSNARGGFSFHQYGLATDIVFKDSKGNWTWDIPFSEWQKMGEIGKGFGLEWGGDWKFQDLPHFQYTKGLASIHTALELYNKGGLDSVWKEIV
jgi:peptidoglycan L-alanyl-D-glutamate endopeptidase CwlK